MSKKDRNMDLEYLTMREIKRGVDKIHRAMLKLHGEPMDGDQTAKLAIVIKRFLDEMNGNITL